LGSRADLRRLVHLEGDKEDVMDDEIRKLEAALRIAKLALKQYCIEKKTWPHIGHDALNQIKAILEDNPTRCHHGLEIRQCPICMR
jgi:hypothetical protein